MVSFPALIALLALMSLLQMSTAEHQDDDTTTMIGGYVLMDTIIPPVNVSDPQLVTQVALSESGTTLVVGVLHVEQGGGFYIYHLVDQQWRQRGDILPEERMTRGWSLSPSGALLAVRHGHRRVKVYTSTGYRVGSAVSSCRGRTVTVNDDYLAVSCDEVDEEPGRVLLYRLTVDLEWEEILTMDGDMRGDGFGSQIAIQPHAGDLFWLAISAPGSKRGTGVVYLFRIDIGQNLIVKQHAWMGVEQGERFGESMALTSTQGFPRLVVGAPGLVAEPGVVRTGTWQEQEDSWTDVAVLTGPTQGDGFGNAIAFSRRGDRIVATAAPPQAFGGWIGIYGEPSDNSDFYPLGNATQDFESLALSGPGSVMALGSKGAVRVYVDKSPFCGVPSDQDDFFLKRRTCGIRPARNQEECFQLQVVRGNEVIPCTWYPTNPQSQVPTIPPTGTPSLRPTHPETPLPSYAVSDAPSAAGNGSMELSACRCNAGGVCLEDSYRPGTEFTVCISGIPPRADLASVTSMHMQHGTHDQSMIENRTPAPGVMISCEALQCQIRIDLQDLTHDESMILVSGMMELHVSESILYRPFRLAAVVSYSTSTTDIPRESRKASAFAVAGMAMAILVSGLLGLLFFCPTVRLHGNTSSR